MKKAFNYLEIVNDETGIVAKRINVTGKSERQVERTENGMMMRINMNDWHVRERDYDEAQPDTDEPKK
jgi:hypothetical protein